MRDRQKTFYNSPLGLIQIEAGERGLLSLTFLLKGAPQTGSAVGVQSSANPGFAAINQVVCELEAYFSGACQQFSIGIDWDLFSGFQKDVLALTAEIPYGEVCTYGGLARALGKPGAARAVGKALGSNPLLIIIPCHRVIGADGRLDGYAGGLDAKVLLLTLEGHRVEGDRILKAG